MRKDITELASKIDGAKVLCQKVLDCGETIKKLSAEEIGADAYAEELTRLTDERGNATRIAIQEINAITEKFEIIKNDETASSAEKAFLREKLHSVQDMNPLFVKQNAILQKNISAQMDSLRQESVEFYHNVGVIKNYLKAPDKKSFYG
ncbi:hypothetical protein AGMMS49938_06620 [Fibrobacterales bacterium]|nr:hypothetical protein AGMMS49938_06620 [Fibrobacterales bacterium]